MNFDTSHLRKEDNRPSIAQPVSDVLSWRRVVSQLRHASVRDLAFLLLSPPLLNPEHSRWQGAVQSFTEQELREWRRWLLVQDIAPAALERFLAQEATATSGDPIKHIRLGRYAEQLMAFALANAPPVLEIKLIARNVPLHASGTRVTAGELDFVIERRGAIEHWELAVKFYLSVGIKSLEDYVSPATFLPTSTEAAKQDTLGAKLAHMFDKQLALETMLKASDAPEFSVSGPITRSCAYVRGWLFYPAFAQGLSAASVPLAWGLHPQHPHGIWIRDRDATTLQSGSWLELPRLGWLSPARMVRNKNREYLTVTLSHSDSEPTRSPSLWAQLKKQDDLSRQELQRVFVVPTIDEKPAAAA